MSATSGPASARAPGDPAPGDAAATGVPPLLRGIGGPLLDSLPPELVDAMSSGARSLVGARGQDVFRDAQERTGIVESGIVRTYLRSGDGRQLTVRYARRGSLVGTLTGLRPPVSRLRLQAVTDCVVVELDRATFDGLVASDARLVQATLQEADRRLNDIYSALNIQVFGSIRDRIVRTLLDVAERDPATGDLLAPITQQALADSIGSAREVVARTLATLRDERLIETRVGAIVIRDLRPLAVSVAGWSDG